MSSSYLREWLESILNERPRKNLSICFYLADVYDLCTQPDLRDQLAQVAVMHESSHVNLSFCFSGRMDIPVRDLGMDDDAHLSGAAKVGKVLGCFKSLDHISFYDCTSPSFSFALALLAPCKQIKRLNFTFQNVEEEFQWEPLRAELQEFFSDHPTLEEVHFWWVRHPSYFQMMGAILAHCAERVSCCIYHARHNLSLEALSALQSLLQIQSTCSLALQYVNLDTAGKVNAFCTALRSIDTLNVKVKEPYFPADLDVQTQVMLANDLARNVVVVELVINCIENFDPQFVEALGRSMTQTSCKLQVLHVASRPFGHDDSLFRFLLCNARTSKLRELHLGTLVWTPKLVEEISAYLRTTLHLRKLTFGRVKYPYGSRKVVPAEFLAALDRPDQPVEVIDFGPYLTQTLDSEWLKQFHFIMKLNSQRREHGARLSEIVTAELLVAAWQEVDHDCMVVFLLRDEFNLKTKFGELMQQLVGYQGKHGSEQE